MAIAAGDLRHRVNIQRRNLQQEPILGEQVLYSWTTIATLWAAIEPLSVREFVAASMETSKVTTRITVRALAAINSTMRVVHGDKIYNIHGVLSDRESGREYLTLACSEGVTDGR